MSRHYSQHRARSLGGPVSSNHRCFSSRGWNQIISARGHDRSSPDFVDMESSKGQHFLTEELLLGLFEMDLGSVVFLLVQLAIATPLVLALYGASGLPQGDIQCHHHRKTEHSADRGDVGHTLQL
jgi:hypothetical protein